MQPGGRTLGTGFGYHRLKHGSPPCFSLVVVLTSPNLKAIFRPQKSTSRHTSQTVKLECSNIMLGMLLPCPTFRTIFWPQTSSWEIGTGSQTIRAYCRAVVQFFQFLNREGLAISTSTPELDALFGEFIIELYHEGKIPSQGSCLISGLKRFIPQIAGSQYYSIWMRVHQVQRVSLMPCKRWPEWLGPCISLRSRRFLFCNFLFSCCTLVILRLSRAPGRLSFHSRTPGLPDAKFVALRPVARAALAPAAAELWGINSALPIPSPKIPASVFANFNLTVCVAGARPTIGREHPLDSTTVSGRLQDQRACRLYLDEAQALLAQLCQSQSVNGRVTFYSHFFYTSFAACNECISLWAAHLT